jgi:hypothetical protein
LLEIKLRVAGPGNKNDDDFAEHQAALRDLTTMEHDWTPVAVTISGGSAALAKAFLDEAEGHIRAYLKKKGMPQTQMKVDIEGYRFAVRCLDGLGSENSNVASTGSGNEDKAGDVGGSASAEGDKKKKKKRGGKKAKKN